MSSTVKITKNFQIYEQLINLDKIKMISKLLKIPITSPQFFKIWNMYEKIKTKNNLLREEFFNNVSDSNANILD